MTMAMVMTMSCAFSGSHIFVLVAPIFLRPLAPTSKKRKPQFLVVFHILKILFIVIRWLGDEDSNLGKQIQSLPSYP